MAAGYQCPPASLQLANEAIGQAVPLLNEGDHRPVVVGPQLLATVHINHFLGEPVGSLPRRAQTDVGLKLPWRPGQHGLPHRLPQSQSEQGGQDKREGTPESTAPCLPGTHQSSTPGR